MKLVRRLIASCSDSSPFWIDHDQLFPTGVIGERNAHDVIIRVRLEIAAETRALRSARA